MARVSREECLTLARLARLALTDDEAQRFAPQLDQIVAYLDLLQSVSVEGIPEYLPSERRGSALRTDVAVDACEPAAVLQAAPLVRQQQVVVPKFKDD